MASRSANTVQVVARAPQQQRSRESFDRVLDATETLLRERAGGEFTIQEVSDRASVSVGGVYTRVANKDDLIRLAQLRMFEQLQPERSGIGRLLDHSGGLVDVVPELIEGFAEFLTRNAQVLRAFMVRAASDPVVAERGRRAHASTTADLRAVLLLGREEIRHPDPDRAVTAIVAIVYAALARYLGLGSAADVAGQGDWTDLKADLARMTLLFLTSP